MKKLFTLPFLVFAMQTSLFSQCIPDSIVFNTQQQIDNFQTDYPGCTEILGTVMIHGDDITNVQGLSILTSIGGDLRIYNNIALASFNGFDNLISIGSYFMLVDNPALVSLSGLEALISVGDNIDIWSNNALTNLSGLDVLTSIDGSLRIWQNSNLSSIAELANLEYLGSTLSIYNNPALVNLVGLEKLEIIHGICEVGNSEALGSLTGLENVTSIGGSLLIRNNDGLTDLSGFASLQHIGGKMTIADNFLLESLAGLNQLHTVDGDLAITYDSLLTDVSALSNLTTIDGYIEIRSNGSLASLSGLDNIDATTIDSLILRGNISLSECAIKSVCDFLAIPESVTNLFANGPLCQSRSQIESRCESLDLNEYLALRKINIYPNPCSTTTSINFELSERKTVEISIYNHLGQQIDFIDGMYSAGKQQIIWEVKEHKAGMYFVKIQAANQLKQGKIVICR